MADSRKNHFNRAAQAILQHLPGGLFGDPEVIHKKYGSYYDRKDQKTRAEEIRLRTAGNYLLILLLFLPMFLFSLFPAGTAEPDRIARPPSDQERQSEDRIAEVEFEGTRVRKDVKIRVPPVSMTPEEKRQSLLSLGKRLPERIKGDNADLTHVTFDLLLPEDEAETGIHIEWFSDDPSVLDEKGQLDTIRAKDGAKVTLTAVASIDEMVMEFPYSVNILPLKDRDHTKALEKRLADVVSRLAHTEGKNGSVSLPKELGEGISISWRSRNTNPLPVLALCMLLLFLLNYLNRYGQLARQRKAAVQSILADLPDFADKLILLLNAGLVTESAIRKIVSDYERQRTAAIRPLYEGLREIEKRMSETNSPLAKELRAFATESGVREFMRFTAILSDNIHKGSSLVEKLESETEFLWLSRKKRAEELGRLAETKLALPLMLELFALILITVAPVLIGL